MTQSNKKPCIQKRIMTRLSKRLPEFWLFASFFLFIAIFLILEKSEYPYSNYLSKLEYSQIKDLVSLIVTTDGFIIAFTGLIATMILRQISERETEEKSAITTTKDERGVLVPTTVKSIYKKKRHEVVKFVSFILLTLVGSIWCSLGVIITQYFPYAVWSIIALFVGLIELVAMLYYSLKI